MTAIKLVDPHTPAERRSMVLAIEQYMLDQYEHIDMPVTHRFVPGLYVREMRMKAGELVVSKLHKTEHVFVISQGDVSVASEFGVERLTAPYTGITKPGTKRVILAHADTVWTTFHVTHKTDVDEIEKDIIAPNYAALDCEVTA